MDASEVGVYGTLRLMKRLEPDKHVAAYPIDQESVSIGRDPQCEIRLYYSQVSPVHAKIVFQDRKAFLVVLGTNGLLVDGCPVFPNPSTAPNARPVTVPLPNNSSIEVHKKRFMFSYPPKDLRPALLATPARDPADSPEKHKRRRALRMSMINTAQVFSPRPSDNARENLRTLKTPIKMKVASPFRGDPSDEDEEDGGFIGGSSRKRRRQSSPLKRGVFTALEEEEEDLEGENVEEQEVVLVEGSRPRVYQEERDLVILEHVPVPEPIPATEAHSHGRAHTPQRYASPRTPIQQHRAPVHPQTQPVPRMQPHFPFVSTGSTPSASALTPSMVPKTPPRRARQSLHKAALLRSVMRREMESEEREQEDDEEAMEVEESVIGENEGAAEGEDAEDAEEEQEVILQEEASNHPMPQARRPPVLGSFMTPQAPRHRNLPPPATALTSRTNGQPYARYAVGGFTPGGIRGAMAGSAFPNVLVSPTKGDIESTPRASGPRRVRLVEPWKVDDIVVEEPHREDEDVREERRDMIVPLKDNDEDGEYEEGNDDTQQDERDTLAFVTTPGRAKREKLSEEERQAILERRRSALHTPDTFFGGQVPGSRRLSLFPLSPAKPSIPQSAAPSSRPLTSKSLFPSTSDPGPVTASVKSFRSGVNFKEEDEKDHKVKSEQGAADTEDKEDEEDTAVLLARMRHMVEGARRRQSVGAGLGGGTGDAVANVGAGPSVERRQSINPFLVPDEREQQHDEITNETGRTGGREESEDEDDSDAGGAADEGFSLLAGARPSIAARLSVGLRGRRVSREIEGGNPAGVQQAPMEQQALNVQHAVEEQQRPQDIEVQDEEEDVEMDALGEPEVMPEEVGKDVESGEGQGDEQDVMDVDEEQDELNEEDQQADVQVEPEQEGEDNEPLSPEIVAEELPDDLDNTDSGPRGVEPGLDDLAEDNENEEEAEDGVEPEKTVRRSPRKPASTRATPPAASASKSRLEPVTRKPRLRSASAEPQAEADVQRTASRRTRKATASPPLTAGAGAVPKKRTRRTPTPEVTVPGSVPSIRKTTRASSVEVLEGAAATEAAHVRRSVRSKLTIAIKEEDEETEETSRAAAPPSRAVATKEKTAPATVPTRGRRPASGIPAPRTATRGALASGPGAGPRRLATTSTATKESNKRELPSTIPRTTAAAAAKATRSAGRVRASEEPEPSTATRVSRTRVRK